MTWCAAHRIFAFLPSIVFASVALACSSSDPATTAQGGSSNSSGGTTSTGGSAVTGGTTASGGTATGGTSIASAGSAGAIATTGGSGGSPSGGGSSGGSANIGGSAAVGGSSSGGQGGASAGGSGSGGGSSSVQSYTCNLVIGIDSTGEWFTSGFENQVPNDRWEIIYHHPGYIEDWAKASDDVYKLTPTSPCTMNADNPDRVIFNLFADGSDSAINNKNAWVTALTQSIANLKAKYSRLKRVDLLTMTRAPNNTPCDSGNAAGSSVAQYVDDAVMMLVAGGPPAVVASPKFFAKDCTVFTSGGPHFTDAGKPVIAKLYGDYYSAEK